MPGGDRSGPMGMGPMTGRGAGFCSGWNRPGWGRGAVRGGRGFGFRSRWWGPGGTDASGDVPPGAATGTDEKQWLEERTRQLEAELQQLRRRLDALQADSKKAD